MLSGKFEARVSDEKLCGGLDLLKSSMFSDSRLRYIAGYAGARPELQPIVFRVIVAQQCIMIILNGLDTIHRALSISPDGDVRDRQPRGGGRAANADSPSCRVVLFE